MATGLFQYKRALQVFGCDPDILTKKGIESTSLPDFARSSNQRRQLKSWSILEMPQVGKLIGFMPPPESPLSVAAFVTKGGVLKSSLTLNFARMAALHGLRTCVVGLDMQGDITEALTLESQEDNDDASLSEAIQKVDQRRGLADFFTGDVSLEDIIAPTDIENLFFISETPELVALDQSLVGRNRREYWLNDHVILPLKKKFDLVIMDCSPNWNRLITNALVASDVLLSPIECKINNFRNLKTFQMLLNEFKKEMSLSFRHIYVATRLSPNRKLSREIFDWYRANLENCLETPIRESTQGEESMALRLSLPEYAPTSTAADEMRTLLQEIWAQCINTKQRLEYHRSSDLNV